ncbi:MAG: hypothetical protein EP326_10100 [Deltaproteobacteria bacterium]|nr:MAG: hypothetical protein EP326_10100 [Deltaproteobacteria bacterium]
MIERIFGLLLFFTLVSCSSAVTHKSSNGLEETISKAQNPWQVLGITAGWNKEKIKDRVKTLLEAIPETDHHLKRKVIDSYALLNNLEKLKGLQINTNDNIWKFTNESGYWELSYDVVSPTRFGNRLDIYQAGRWRLHFTPFANDKVHQKELEHIRREISFLRLQHRKPGYEEELRALKEKEWKLLNATPESNKISSNKWKPRFEVEMGISHSRREPADNSTKKFVTEDLHQRLDLEYPEENTIHQTLEKRQIKYSL